MLKKHISKRWTPNGDKGQKKKIEHETRNTEHGTRCIGAEHGFNSLILLLLNAIAMLSGGGDEQQ